MRKSEGSANENSIEEPREARGATRPHTIHGAANFTEIFKPKVLPKNNCFMIHGTLLSDATCAIEEKNGVNYYLSQLTVHEPSPPPTPTSIRKQRKILL